MNDWTKDLKLMLEGYVKSVDDAVAEALPKVGKEAVKELKNTSPKNTGRYSKGWRQKVESDGVNGTKLTVYNATSYQLTHLLENGHALRGGGFISGRPHIKPAQDKAEKKAVEEITKAIQNYG